MNDVIARQFNLTPPNKDELRALVADLSEDERHVLLEHGTEAPFCGVFLEEKREGVYTCRLCGLPLFKAGTKFESGTGWPSFTSPFLRKPPPIYSRHQLRYGPHGDRLHSLRRTPGACLSRRAAANWRAILHQFHLARIHAEWRTTSGQTRPGCSRGRGVGELMTLPLWWHR